MTREVKKIKKTPNKKETEMEFGTEGDLKRKTPCRKYTLKRTLYGREHATLGLGTPQGAAWRGARVGVIYSVIYSQEFIFELFAVFKFSVFLCAPSYVPIDVFHICG